MPPTKQAAKKASAKETGPEHEKKDLRRAYEHLGRVELLRKLSGHDEVRVGTLITLAQAELHSGHAKAAADLLRAAEHFSFAFAGESSQTSLNIPDKLKEAINEERKRLLQKAKEHWDEHEPFERHAEVNDLYHQGLKEAEHASKHGSNWPSLELARGVEALAHVKKQERKQLGAPKDVLQLATV